MSTTKDKSQGPYTLVKSPGHTPPIYYWIERPNGTRIGPFEHGHSSKMCKELNAAYSSGLDDRDELVKKVKVLEFALGEAHCAMNYRGWSTYEKGSLEHKAFHAANRIRNPHHY